jgi:hypothetical protein
MSDDYKKVNYAKGDRVVKHLMFSYVKESPSPVNPGATIYTEGIAKRGEVLEAGVLPDHERDKGDKLGSFYNEAETDVLKKGGVSEERVAEGEGDVQNMSVEELADYINENKLSVNDTIELAGEDGELAERLLDAETLARGNDPRKGVEEGLTAVITRSAQ